MNQTEYYVGYSGYDVWGISAFFLKDLSAPVDGRAEVVIDLELQGALHWGRVRNRCGNIGMQRLGTCGVGRVRSARHASL